MMDISIFQPMPYISDNLPRGWPHSPRHFDPNSAIESQRLNFQIIDVADDLGFDYVTVAEHHYAARQLCPSPALVAASLAPRLKNAKIAVLGTDLPLHNPIAVAEEYAALDGLFPGRLLLGLFRGTPNEYVTYGTNPAESRAMFEEGVDLLLRAWSEPEPFAWQGIHYQHRMVSIWPQPVSGARLPVLVSGNSAESIAFAVERRFRIGLSYAPIERVAQLAELYRSTAAAAGWEPPSENILYRGFCYVAETDEQAIEDCRQFGYGDLQGILKPDARRAKAEGTMMGGVMAGGWLGKAAGGPPPMVSGIPVFCGSPETVLGQIKAMHDLGIGHIDAHFLSDELPFEHGLQSLKLFGTEVLPELRKL